MGSAEATSKPVNWPGAVAVFCWHQPSGTILSCARKHDDTAWGLPGGKIEYGETPAEAAARELEEETGFYTNKLQIVYADVFDNRICVTYTVDPFGVELFHQAVLRQIPGEGLIDWRSPQDLVNGPFGDYNKKLFDIIGVSYDNTQRHL